MASRGVDPYGASVVSGGNRSPRPSGNPASARQRNTAGGGLYSTGLAGELPTVDRSPSRGGGGGSYGPAGPYSQPGSARGSPVGRRGAAALAAATGRPHISRSSNSSPLLGDHGYYVGGGGGGYGGAERSGTMYGMESTPYYGMQDDLLGMDSGMDRRSGPPGGTGHHRSRSVSRSGAGANPSGRYGSEPPHHEREFVPIREPRERSLDRGGGRERSLDRGGGMYMEDDMYGPPQTHRSARQSPSANMMGGVDGRGGYIGELTLQNNDLQRELANLKKELELTSQKLGSSMHSIKTFWSPELKKERALRKEESAKYSLINDQLKLLNSENQKQAMLVRQLEEELRMRMRNPSIEMQQQMEALFTENEHLTREITILRETIKELELRIDTQKQTLQARDESIKKLLEMLQNKGIGKEEERLMFQQMQAVAQKQLEEFRAEISRRDQELLGVSAKMKTLEEQHQDYQRHIAVLKESLCAKEEHYNMLQADVEELRQRLEEKNRLIEKKTQAALQASQERNRVSSEVGEMRDHMDIKERKINVLQRKIDLYEANQRLSSGAAQNDEATAQRKQLEEQRRRLEEHRRQLDTKVKQLEEKEKALADVDQKLKKRKDKMDQLEAQMQKQQATQQQQMSQQAQQVTQQSQQQLQQQTQQLQQQTQQLQQQQQQLQQEKQQIQQQTQSFAQQQQQFAQQQQQIAQERQQFVQQQQQFAQERQKLQAERQQMQAERQKILQQQKAGGPGAKPGASPELEKEVAKAKEDAKRAQDEMERLLQLVQMSQEEQNSKEKTIMELQNALKNAQAKLKAQQAHAQAEEEEERIEELQEALRESVRLTVVEEQRRNELAEKVGRLEKRVRSLQSARSLRCPTCRPLLCRVPALQQRLERLLAERRAHLEDLVHMKREALEAALSEKDAHVALLEVGGVRTAQQAEQLEQLRADRSRLTLRLQLETEQAARLLAQLSLQEEEACESTGPPCHVLLDVLLNEAQQDEEEDNVEPDSLDESPRTSVSPS